MEIPMTWLRTGIVALGLTLLGGCASGPERTGIATSFPNDELQIYVEEDVAYLSGVLDRDLPGRLKAMIADHPNVTDLVLVDVPGSVDQNATMASAQLIRRLGLNTHIAKTGYVLSGGVDLFLGGKKRTIGAGAGVGVHSWRSVEEWGSDVNLADPVHAAYVNFYLAMGVPERFYWFTLEAAPPERVYFLSPEEIYEYQLVTPR